MASNYDIGFHDSCGGLRTSRDGTHTLALPHEGLDLVLAELGHPSLDCSPRAPPEDSNSKYCHDDDEEEQAFRTYTRHLDDVRQTSLESSFFFSLLQPIAMCLARLIYPLMPPPKPASAPECHKARMASSVTP
ncbi:hypothetical protein J3R83DRAFT_11069 [Lanmaoa asiatica]|nr:hypothetical protein J3R83DRAFT_11069 [Lanmaoa asiatica]